MGWNSNANMLHTIERCDCRGKPFIKYYARSRSAFAGKHVISMQHLVLDLDLLYDIYTCLHCQSWMKLLSEEFTQQNECMVIDLPCLSGKIM